CRKYCPSLTVDDLLPREAGIRAQAVHRDGSLENDFLFAETDRMVHVCNAPSPAATSALPIGRMIAERVAAHRASARTRVSARRAGRATAPGRTSPRVSPRSACREGVRR